MLRRIAVFSLVSVFLQVLLASLLTAQPTTPWYEREVPLRDGKVLAADLYSRDTLAAKPVILVQTPYNKDWYRIILETPKTASFPFDTRKYHYLMLDWRGFHGSSDAAVAGYDRGLDGYDAVEWIAQQRWCNGKVGTWGPSALGAIQFLTARHQPPHLICAVPLVKDFKLKYGDYYYGGVFRREHIEGLEKLGFLTVDMVLSHPSRDIFWLLAEQKNDFPEEIDVPMLLISGWYDHFPDDILRAFDDLRERSAAGVRQQHRLIMGPWLHEEVDLEKQADLFYPEGVGVARNEAMRFLDYHLLGAKNGWPLTPAIQYFQMGSDEWRSTDSWESVSNAAATYYFSEDGSLSKEIPASGVVEFPYDPRNPSPSYGGDRFNPFDPSVVPGPLDIRAVVESRPDAAIFTTPPIDDSLAIAGAVTATLYVSSDRIDTDFALRFCDVYPDGRSMIVTDGIRRLRFRDSYEKEKLASPGTVYELKVTLQDLALTLKKGHRLRLVLTSSNYPRFDVNINNGEPLYVAGDTLVARNTLHCGGANASRIDLLTVGRTTSLSEPPHPAVGKATIQSIHPNPISLATSPAATLIITNPRAGAVQLRLFDMLGRVVKTISTTYMSAGHHVLRLDPRAGTGRTLSPGTYMLELRGSGDLRGPGNMRGSGNTDTRNIVIIR